MRRIFSEINFLVENRYNSSGFLGLQNIIETSFISEKISRDILGNRSSVDISMDLSTAIGPRRFLSAFQCFLGLFAGTVSFLFIFFVNFLICF